MSPHRSDKNIGKAYNDDISLTPDDAWICIHDSDACFLLPYAKTYLENVIEDHGNEYALIGCMTNRLGLIHQCVDNEFSENFDLIKAYNDATKVWKENGTRVDEVDSVAGLMMLFKKSTWKMAGGFIENTYLCDLKFSKRVKSMGMKIGLAKGIYMFHGYRLWEAGNGHGKTRRSTKHIK